MIWISQPGSQPAAARSAQCRKSIASRSWPMAVSACAVSEASRIQVKR